MMVQSLYNTYRRYRALQTHRLHTLPIVILMPHSACNCRCVMCDIWKDNKNLKQLTENDIVNLLDSLKKLDTRQVLMSGGEALLNPHFFRFCEILRQHEIKVTLLSTGLLLGRHAASIADYVQEVIVSLDGPAAVHDRIRNTKDAYEKMREGIASIRRLKPGYRITGRTVIHRLNFRHWPEIIESAKELGLDQISFLPADTSSHAFNREILWSEQRQEEVNLAETELPELEQVLERVIARYEVEQGNHFIAESAVKLRKIAQYYKASHGLALYPSKKCNAPWVSAVVEADGTVRPCFFHPAIGNAKSGNLEEILNNPESIRFRRELDMDKNETCVKCVCYLHLSPGTKI